MMEGFFQTELVQNAGYSAESYEVVTQDGYVLQLDRITASPNIFLSSNKTPVLLLHGILDCSVTWIAAGPGVGLGIEINHLYFFIFRQCWTKERLKFVFAYHNINY